MDDPRTPSNAHTGREQEQRASPISWGSSGRRFKSCQPDKEKPAPNCNGAGFLLSGVSRFRAVSMPSVPTVCQENHRVSRAGVIHGVAAELAPAVRSMTRDD